MLALLLSSCSAEYEKLLASGDTDAKYKAAFDYYNKGKYKRSAELFESLIMAMSGYPQEDTVYFYTGMSNYKKQDYVTAESNFERFTQVFPRSPFSEEASYLRCFCLYEKTYSYELDQMPTRKTISVIGEFNKEFPSSKYANSLGVMLEDLSERLDRKSYEGAKLYYKMEDYLAAHYALKNVLRENADNVYRVDVLYYTALSAYYYASKSVNEKQRERYLTFIDDYYNFISEESESSRRRFLDGLYQKALKVTKGTGNVEYEEGVVNEKQAQREKRKLEKQAAKEEKKAKAALKAAEKEQDKTNEGKQRASRDKVKEQNKAL